MVEKKDQHYPLKPLTPEEYEKIKPLLEREANRPRTAWEDSLDKTLEEIYERLKKAEEAKRIAKA